MEIYRTIFCFIIIAPFQHTQRIALKVCFGTDITYTLEKDLKNRLVKYERFLVLGEKLKILKQEKTQLKYYIALTLTILLYGNESCIIKARDINRI
jgi:hypothetical protein